MVISFLLMVHWLLSITDSTLEDVKKLKVCIELNGLRLNKPRLPGDLSQWLSSSQRLSDVDKNFRMDVPTVRGRSEVNGGWCDPTFVRRDDPRSKTNKLPNIIYIYVAFMCVFYILHLFFTFLYLYLL